APQSSHEISPGGLPSKHFLRTQTQRHECRPDRLVLGLRSNRSEDVRSLRRPSHADRREPADELPVLYTLDERVDVAAITCRNCRHVPSIPTATVPRWHLGSPPLRCGMVLYVARRGWVGSLPAGG